MLRPSPILPARGGKFCGVDRPRRPAGLTLVEMSIVLAILGILFVVAAPHLATFSSGYKLRGAAREVATDLHFARLLAIKENCDFRVTFGPRSYQVFRVNDGIVAKDRIWTADYPEITLSDGTITFHSRGDASANTILLSSPEGSRSVSVALNGRVRIE